MKPLRALLLATSLLIGPALLSAADKPAAEPQYDMTTYYFCLLTKGPNRTHTQEEANKIQDGHMANMARLAKEGKLLVAGPFINAGDWRGLFIFKCATLEEAQALVATDPAIVSGRLKAEIHPWMTAKGYIHDPEFPPAK